MRFAGLQKRFTLKNKSEFRLKFSTKKKTFK